MTLSSVFVDGLDSGLTVGNAPVAGARRNVEMSLQPTDSFVTAWGIVVLLGFSSCGQPATDEAALGAKSGGVTPDHSRVRAQERLVSSRGGPSSLVPPAVSSMSPPVQIGTAHAL